MSERTCSVDTCERKHYGRGFCQLHYNRVRKYGAPDGKYQRRTPGPCKIDGCEKLANVPGSAHGWCSRHYQRWQRWGDPLRERAIVVGVAECGVDGCSELVRARGWCVMHWTRWRRFGDPQARARGEVVDGRRLCPMCRVDQPLSNYGLSRAYCKPCTAARARHRRQSPAVKAALHQAYLRRREQDPEAFARWARKWRERNPNKVREHNATRRARLRGAIAETFDPLEVFERDGWICGLCNQPIDPKTSYPDMLSPSLDHIVPLSRGGLHSRANCQASHLLCNVKKGPRVA